MPAGREQVSAAADATVTAGLMLSAGATFAPWLRSGARSRDGYETARVVRRLVGLDAAQSVALHVAVLLVPMAGVAVLALLAGHGLRRPALGRAGLALAVVVAALGIGCAAVALRTSPRFGVAVETTGPVLGLVGGGVVVVALALRLANALRGVDDRSPRDRRAARGRNR